MEHIRLGQKFSLCFVLSVSSRFVYVRFVASRFFSLISFIVVCFRFFVHPTRLSRPMPIPEGRPDNRGATWRPMRQGMHWGSARASATASPRPPYCRCGPRTRTASAFLLTQWCLAGVNGANTGFNAMGETRPQKRVPVPGELRCLQGPGGRPRRPHGAAAPPKSGKWSTTTCPLR